MTRSVLRKWCQVLEAEILSSDLAWKIYPECQLGTGTFLLAS